MKHIFFFILTALAFSSCKTADKPKKYSLDCYVRFLESEGRIRAEATLREGDANPQPVEAPGGITYQKKPMTLRQAAGFSYKTESSGGVQLKHIFSWKDEKGVSHDFEMDLSPITDFGFGSKTISRQKPASFRWSGLPLGKGETIVFLWENAALGKTVPMEIYNTGGMPIIEFPAAQIAKLDAGTWTLYLVRKKLTKTDADGVANSGIIEYYTKTDTIEVK